jgi:hypothetical protein
VKHVASERSTAGKVSVRAALDPFEEHALEVARDRVQEVRDLLLSRVTGVRRG